MNNSTRKQSQDIHFSVRRPEEATHLWVISFSDFMTILMIFFLVLFAYRVWSKQAAWEAERVKLLELAQQTQKGLVQRLARMASVDVQAQRIDIHLSDELLFEPGQANLKTSAYTLFKQICPELARFKGDIIVEGHTDNQPLGRRARYASNWELSVARAFTVIHYLTSHGVDPAHIVARGYGPYRPRVNNDTPEHRAANRRIEIVLLSTMKDGTP